MPQVKQILPYGQQAARKLRVAAYCRVSTNSADQLNSYANQIKQYTKTIKNNPLWELVEIFADEGISGMQAENRPEFQRMIRMCELRQIDLILTKSMSRFARNAKESLEYVRKLKLLGIGVRFENQGIDTLSLGDEMIINTFSALAQEESEATSQHLRLSIVRRMEAGEFVDSNAPYGFRLVNKKLEIYEPEAERIREIFKKYINGWSAHEIARWLTEEGVATKAGAKEWTSWQIRYMLTNERYIGDCFYQKNYSEKTVPFKQHRNRGEEDRFYAKNTHDAIVDRETFEIANRLLKERREKHVDAPTSNRYPLSSKICCAECGTGFLRRLVNGNIKWACKKHVADRHKCESNYYSEERIYDGFTSMVNKLRFCEENIIGQVIAKLEMACIEYKRNNQIAKGISQSIAELNAKLLMLDGLHSKGYLAIEVYQSQSREIRQQISSLKAERQDTYESRILEMLGQVKHLKELIDEIEEPLEDFNEKLFYEIVTSISINRHDEMTVTMLGGLKFTELI